LLRSGIGQGAMLEEMLAVTCGSAEATTVGGIGIGAGGRGTSELACGGEFAESFDSTPRQ
jgi:hypothetical protein